RELLKAKLDDEVNQCLLKDDEGWTSLHCASQKGKIDVIEELIRTCPQCLEQVTEKGETVLHVAVKANQFEAVKVLADSIMRHNFHNLLKAQDRKGKTAYQLAAAKSQTTLSLREQPQGVSSRVAFSIPDVQHIDLRPIHIHRRFGYARRKDITRCASAYGVPHHML
ncbi:hypothetical protein K1719_044234, partial [Acacia pycnantha]